MALLGNYTVINRSPGRFFGGNSTVGAQVVQTRANWGKRGPAMGRFVGEGAYLPQSPVPDGYRPPYCQMMALKEGSIAAHTYGITGTGTLTLATDLAGGVYIDADLEGTGSLTADVGLIVQLVAALSGAGALSADIVGIVQVDADLTGSSSVSASLGALADMLADLSGTGTASATVTALGHISADLTPFTELSPESLAVAVWEALADDHNDPDTMGELLNGAGGGSSPSQIAEAVWEELLADHQVSGTYGDFVAHLLTVAKYLGLK